MKKHFFSILITLFLEAAFLFLLPMPVNSIPGITLTAHAASKNPLNYKTKRLLKGESFLLGADTQQKITYTSRQKSIATVSKKGKVTARKAGKTVIDAKIGSKKYSCLVTVTDTVDLILFAGQSNMTGRGDASLAPKLTDGAGYECRTVTDPNHLVPISEPFGWGQDNEKMADGMLRTGSLVTAFVNEYFKRTGTPVVGVSATVVGSGRISWSTIHYEEAARRLNRAQKALKKNKLKTGHIFVVYMQGENDAFTECSAEEYTDCLKQFYRNLQNLTDVENCLLIRIGRYTKEPLLYDSVIEGQTQLCRKNKNFVLISTKAATLPDSCYQEDGLHITQKGLNTIGKEAGKYAGYFARSGIEPKIRDEKYQNTYIPKNK